MDIFSSGLTSSALLSGISANVQDSIASVGPIIELVVGILLAMIFINLIIKLFEESNSPARDEDGVALYEDYHGHIHHGDESGITGLSDHDMRELSEE